MLPAVITRTAEREWKLAGSWTVRGLGDLAQTLDAEPCETGEVVLEGSALEAIDTAGVWVLQHWLNRNAAQAARRGWPEKLDKLLSLVAAHPQAEVLQPARRSPLERTGRRAAAAWEQTLGMLQFVGQIALVALRLVAHPGRFRWRTMLRNVQIGGFDALPIIGLTSFLLGIVVAYQGADHLGLRPRPPARRRGRVGLLPILISCPSQVRRSGATSTGSSTTSRASRSGASWSG